MAIAFLDELRVKISTLSYTDVDKATTVSIGLSIADPLCPFTDRELLDLANRAKNFAKQQGKNRIATYEGSPSPKSNLVIVRP